MPSASSPTASSPTSSPDSTQASNRESEVPALDVSNVRFSYGETLALDRLSLSVAVSSIFGILGPNGSGKSTLFRLISTLAPMQGTASVSSDKNGHQIAPQGSSSSDTKLQDSGDIRVFGVSLRADRQSVRQMLGVVFQSPSLDPKLTVIENIQCQATLYGLSGSLASERISESIQLLGLNEKINERTDKLSGGLKRRVELAKGMLHRPRLLLLDEPSTGLDPSARRDFWQALERLRAEFGTTIVLTTHLMEEAEECDSIAIIDRGQCIVHGTPRELRQSAGQQIVTIECENPSAVADRIRDGRQLEVQLVQSQVRVSSPDAADLARWVTEEFGERVDSVTIGRPSLVDVFISETGRSFY